MAISIIIEKESVSSVNVSAVKNVRGIWINADVNVFIPLDVIEGVRGEAEECYVPQDEAQDLFFKLEKLKKSKPTILGDWEINFLDSLSEWFDSGMKFSKKQKSKIKSVAENFADELNAMKSMQEKSEDPIPF